MSIKEPSDEQLRSLLQTMSGNAWRQMVECALRPMDPERIERFVRRYPDPEAKLLGIWLFVHSQRPRSLWQDRVVLFSEAPAAVEALELGLDRQDAMIFLMAVDRAAFAEVSSSDFFERYELHLDSVQVLWRAIETTRSIAARHDLEEAMLAVRSLASQGRPRVLDAFDALRALVEMGVPPQRAVHLIERFADTNKAGPNAIIRLAPAVSEAFGPKWLQTMELIAEATPHSDVAEASLEMLMEAERVGVTTSVLDALHEIGSHEQARQIFHLCARLLRQLDDEVAGTEVVALLRALATNPGDMVSFGRIEAHVSPAQLSVLTYALERSPSRAATVLYPPFRIEEHHVPVAKEVIDTFAFLAPIYASRIGWQRQSARGSARSHRRHARGSSCPV